MSEYYDKLGIRYINGDKTEYYMAKLPTKLNGQDVIFSESGYLMFGPADLRGLQMSITISEKAELIDTLHYYGGGSWNSDNYEPCDATFNEQEVAGRLFSPQRDMHMIEEGYTELYNNDPCSSLFTSRIAFDNQDGSITIIHISHNDISVNEYLDGNYSERFDEIAKLVAQDIQTKTEILGENYIDSEAVEAILSSDPISEYLDDNFRYDPDTVNDNPDYSTSAYSIRLSLDRNHNPKLFIMIKTSPPTGEQGEIIVKGYLDEALQQIRDWKINPNNYRIEVGYKY